MSKKKKNKTNSYNTELIVDRMNDGGSYMQQSDVKKSLKVESWEVERNSRLRNEWESMT